MLKYLASPYTHPDEAVREARFREVLRVACALINRGHPVIAPIAFYHEMHKCGKLPCDIAFWARMDKELLKGCTALWIATMPGWTESKGVHKEISWAREFKLTIWLIDPLTLDIQPFE